MSEAKHTPGPWTVLPKELDCDYIRIRGTVLGGRYKIANVLHPSGRNLSKELRKREVEETLANVRLIAAAPKLLEALEVIVAAFDGDIADALKAAQAAIAEAKGQQP